MDIAAELPPAAAQPPASESPAAPPTALRTWIVEGLRAGLLLRPRVAGEALPWQVFAILLLCVAAEIALARLGVPGSAAFHVRGAVVSWWSAGIILLAVWWLLSGLAPMEGERPQGVASWFALWLLATMPGLAFNEVTGALQARGWLPSAFQTSAVLGWGVYIATWIWFVGLTVALGRRFGLGAGRLAVLGVVVLAVYGFSAAYVNDRPWYSDAPPDEDRPRLTLGQETFETQQDVWRRSVAALAPQRPGVRDVYGLVFAPYAREDVFLRESTMVAEVLARRFDAQGRVLQLVNHATTADRLPWATPLNLRRAVQALAQRMDRDNDLLVVYLTSHGARNFQLAAAHWPLAVEGIGPAELRTMLDEAGVRHRVVAISACYSGGWIAPLASDTTLVMTAADPDHTSYGCGRLSELTFFGRAVFDEQLRSTHSFEQAFTAAVPVIRQREDEAGKSDGFSNPQISVGDKIRPVLAEVQKRLDGLPRP